MFGAVTKTDNYGWSPLHYAAFHNKLDITKLLLSNNININQETSSMQVPDTISGRPKHEKIRTPLHFAAAEGNWAIVLALLRGSANVHALDQDGYTPLVLAMMNRQDQMQIAADSKTAKSGSNGLETNRGLFQSFYTSADKVNKQSQQQQQQQQQQQKLQKDQRRHLSVAADQIVDEHERLLFTSSPLSFAESNASANVAVIGKESIVFVDNVQQNNNNNNNSNNNNNNNLEVKELVQNNEQANLSSPDSIPVQIPMIRTESEANMSSNGMFLLMILL